MLLNKSFSVIYRNIDDDNLTIDADLATIKIFTASNFLSDNILFLVYTKLTLRFNQR